MRSVRSDPLVGLAAQLAVLVALAATVGLGVAGWTAAGGYAVVGTGLLARGLERRGRDGFGPADWVTLARASLVGAIAALVADSFDRAIPVPLLVVLAVIALTLDAVDGRVARATGTSSDLGARFDMEVDAFLILVLSVYAAPLVGGGVLAIGLARYAFAVAGWMLPWLHAWSPPRFGAKVVAAIQGIVLAAVAADVLPREAAQIAVGVAGILLAGSFARQTWWLWRHRGPTVPFSLVPSPARTVGAGLLVWFVLIVPSKPSLLAPDAFARIPLEALVLVALALVLPPVARRVTARVFGVLLGLLVIVKAIDVGFYTLFDRSFDLISDWYYLGPGVGVLGDSIGRFGALVVAAAAVTAAVAVVVVMPFVVVRLVEGVTGVRHVSIHVVVAVGLVAALCVAAGVRLGPAGPVASMSAANLAIGRLHADIRDHNVFAAEIAADPLRQARSDQLFTTLRGKDVLVVFVESYGRIAVQDSSFAPGIDAVLTSGTRSLAAAGFTARSAFLTSPTFGAGSWLAHATLQSGLWVNSQQRYNQLLTQQRLTLSRAFGDAGWRTVSVVPADTIDWPQGKRFYGFDALYDSRNVGYRGPGFGYAPMPDQFVWSAFQRLELARPHRAPVMAEIDLVSSHHPWTPLPRPVPWNAVGDGSVFDAMPEEDQVSEAALADPAQVRALYGRSVEYTLGTLFSFVQTYPDPNLVVVMVGDHQPHAYVAGDHPGHDVPISIIAHDPAVLRAIGSWGWQAGLLPDPTAPVWPMSTFRDRFATAYSPQLSVVLPDVTPALPGP
ncbi:hypothetical protein GCM10022240_06950 [Microbacterium kribbense]|uniref:CDP-alcohol phosphatidyltransferase n=1 Tax=Microbacterium kribbense TaxID=433645 RepID=A0ABP7G7L9_9MICO